MPPSSASWTPQRGSGYNHRHSMWIGRVVGTVVATQKDASFAGRKILLVQQLLPGGLPIGEPIVAVDTVDAGAGERVLVTLEGRSAREALGDARAPVDAAIVGIVDRIDLLPADAGGTAR